MADYTRQYDLEMLSEAIKNAKSSTEERHYEKIMWKILGESEPIGVLRIDLMRAMRVGDTRRVKYIENHIHKIRMDETAGHSYGNAKGESIDARR